MNEEKQELEIRRFLVGPAGENCYIVWLSGRRDALVIDPGDEGEKILEGMGAMGVAPGAVLLTHGHFDHTGGLTAFSGAPFYLHPDDLPMLNDPALNAGFMTGDSRPRPDGALPLTEGETMSLCGMSVRVLHTPGHTPGSVCFLVEDQALFTGDTLFERGVGRTDLFGGDAGRLRASLDRLLSLTRDLPVYPGHGGPTSVFRERRWLWN